MIDLHGMGELPRPTEPHDGGPHVDSGVEEMRVVAQTLRQETGAWPSLRTDLYVNARDLAQEPPKSERQTGLWGGNGSGTEVLTSVEVEPPLSERCGDSFIAHAAPMRFAVL